MKRSMFLPALLLAAVAFLSVSQIANAASLRCVGADGKTACTAAQFSDLQTGLATGKRMHKPLLMDVESISEGKDGTIVCRKAGGEQCDDKIVDAIVQLGSSTKPTAAPFHVVKTTDSASPNLMR